ncbi:methyl-accepting chemotaxis protein [Chitinibacter sp. FCG-7]|uniref:Methyl-accepting chemotaxis protein n=1 Tax=Chitinibacter mangrovi TaxID=3153927 RepID=A0AAU7FEZ4_9NEIS
MAWFSNLRLMSKLIVSFLVVATIALLIGGIAVKELKVMTHLMSSMYADRLVPIRDLSKVETQNLHHYRRLYVAIMFQNRERTLDLVKQNTDTEQALDSLFTAYENTLLIDEEKRLITVYKQQLPAYRASAKKVTDLLLAEQPAEAQSVLSNETRPLYDALAATIGKLIKVNDDYATQIDQESRSTAEQMVQLMVGLMLGGFVLAVVIGLFVTRMIMRQVGGEPSEAVAVLQRVADGDLTVRVNLNANDHSSMLFSIQQMVSKLTSVIGEVTQSANALASASEEVSASAQTLSQNSSEQAASVEQTSAAVEEITSTISQNADNARITDGMASKSASDAGDGGEAVKKTVVAMQQIANKISIVDDIAYQTNLLALNAAIEAARAGEHGKGFAVVAAEVRKLAERSQIAAQEISELASNSVTQAQNAGHLLDEMLPSIRKTADLVQEISAASREQSNGIDQINSAINQLAHTTQLNASSSEELSATAEEMSTQAIHLQETVGFFRVGTI